MDQNFDDVISFRSLYQGLQKSQKNVLWKDSVAGYSLNGLKNTYRLRQKLLNGTYQISPYQYFQIHEPKTRDILATCIRDRQFQRSFCDGLLYPNVTRTFIRTNCACQKGRGVDDALNQMKLLLRRYYNRHKTNEGWILQCDIQKYFPSTPHRTVFSALEKVIQDKRTLCASYGIVESFSCMPIFTRLKDDFGMEKSAAFDLAYRITMERIQIIRASVLEPQTVSDVTNAALSKVRTLLGKIPFHSTDEKENFVQWSVCSEMAGVGLGSQVSQILQLLVLNYLDHQIKEKLHVKEHVRYMDDFELLNRSKQFLQKCLSYIDAHVKGIGLSLNHKTCIRPIKQGFVFLKWKFILTESGKVIMRMSKKKIAKQRVKMRRMAHLVQCGKIQMDAVRDSFKGWRANARRGNTRELVLKMEAYYKELFREEAPA